MRKAVFVLLVIGIVGLPIAWSANRLATAKQNRLVTTARVAHIRSQAETVLDLRSREQIVAERKRPEQDVISRINAILDESGIPSNRFAGLNSEAETAVNSASKSPLRRQSVRVTFNDLSISEIGEFLDRWNTTQPLWIPARIELTHDRGGDANDAGRYTMIIVLSATYIADSESS